MSEVVTFGEVMIRLMPVEHLPFEEADMLYSLVGGSEYNMAVSCRRMGHSAVFVTVVPDNPYGARIIAQCDRHAIGGGIKKVKFDGLGRVRMGQYLVEQGYGSRGDVVTYDRYGSAISQVKKGDFDWKEIFKGAKWFHFSGITPALGANVAEVCMEACETARSMGLKISIDLNYRGKLWTKDQARKTMSEIVGYVDIVIGNEEDCATCLGIVPEGVDDNYKDLKTGAYKVVADKVFSRWGNVKMVATTLREVIQANINMWRAIVVDRASGKLFESKKYEVHVIDRLGGGDSFSGALVSGLIEGMDTQDALELAVAWSNLTHTYVGDICMATRGMAEKIAAGGGARVQR
ncbi:sugar kinase [bacterium]|nr:sugar kinase [bacterium]